MNAQQPPPTLLPGWPAMTLIVRGAVSGVIAGSFVIPIAFESKFPAIQPYYTVTLAVISYTLLTISGVWTFKGYAKVRQERMAGYTTIPLNADKEPNLFLVHRLTHEVVSGPYELRPKNLSKKSLKAFHESHESDRSASGTQ